MIGQGGVPGWASFFAPGEHRHFLQLVYGYFDRLGQLYSVVDGVVQVTLPGLEQPSSLGLQNLAQKCRAAPAAQWSQLIEGHFSALLMQEQTNPVDDFETARPMLRIRLYEPGDLEKRPIPVLSRPLGALTAVLALDLPKVVSTVSTGQLAKWAREVNELFQIARDNVRAEPAPQRGRLALDGGGELQLLHGDSFFTASRAVFLEDDPELQCDEGVLVAVPNRHTVLCFAIRDDSVFEAIKAMAAVTIRQYKDGPGSLSPHLFHLRRGAFVRLPIEEKGRGIELRPPAEFAAVLNRIAEAKPPSA